MDTMLITGGAGFIGSNFIHYMMDHHPDYRIINVDKLTYAGNLENLKDIEANPNYTFVKADICDVNAINDVFSSYAIDYIINFAAESHVDRSIEDPSIFLKTNILGTQVLLDAARKYGVKKFVQISTDEVYGSLGPTGYFTEDTSLSPNSPYSASKASADMLVMAYYRTYGLPVNITRCSNNYGPYQFPEKLIPLFVTNALSDKELPLYGDGKNIRDWIYVEDHCSAVDLVLHKGVEGEVYNIGGRSEKANIEITELILDYLGKPHTLIKYVKDRLGHDRRYAIDCSKIEKELGWKPAYSFEDGMKKTIRWYIDNQPWWEKIKSGEYMEYYERMYAGR
jgi:dTDP-glucose 4,6-dehydratase